MKNNNVQHFTLLKEQKNSKYNNYIKYAKEIRKRTAVFNRCFVDLDQYNKIFEIYSSFIHIDAESAPEYLQMELIDLQYNNESKYIFETSEYTKPFYNIYVTNDKFQI